MTTVEQARLVGEGVDRVDGPLKVTGAARYPNDFGFPELAHAALVRSTVAAGRISRLDTRAAQDSPGVLAVITHRNAPTLGRAPDTFLSAPPPPLQDDRILHYGQYVAVVVAGTAEEATAAARRVEAEYESTEPVLDLHDPRAEVLTDPFETDSSRGDAEAALASAEVTFEATYTTAANTNNPLGLFTTVAAWDGDALTVHDSTQWPAACARRSRGCSASRRAGCACWSRSSAAASGRGCACGRTSSWRRWPRVRWTGPSSSC